MNKTNQITALIEDLQAEMLEQCRIIGAGAERELIFLAKIEQLTRENEELRSIIQSISTND